VVSDVEGFGMAEGGAAADLEARAAMQRQRTPDGTPHEHIDRAVSDAETPVQLDQSFAGIGAFEESVETRLEFRIAGRRPEAMHGLDDTAAPFNLNGHRRPARSWRRPVPPAAPSCPDGSAATGPHAPRLRI